MYTVNYDEMTLANIAVLSPYLISDISEQDYGFEARKEMGLIFDDPSQAMEKAKSIFYVNYFESMAEYPTNERMYIIAYNVEKKMLEEIAYEYPPFKCKRYFKTEEDAKKALSKIGIKNFAKYVLELNGQTLYAEVTY